jgi:hypothetical protein
VTAYQSTFFAVAKIMLPMRVMVVLKPVEPVPANPVL